MQLEAQSTEIAELFAAVSAFLGEVEAPSKNAINPHFKNRYADLSEVLSVARPVLAKHGLALIQTTAVSEGVVYCVTTLGHKSGQWVRSFWPVIPGRNDPQGYGSALTYARRYGASSILGLAPEDDDGEAAAREPTKPQDPTPAQVATMRKAFAALGVDDVGSLVDGKVIDAAAFENLKGQYASLRKSYDSAKGNGKRSIADIVREQQ